MITTLGDPIAEIKRAQEGIDPEEQAAAYKHFAEIDVIGVLEHVTVFDRSPGVEGDIEEGWAESIQLIEVYCTRQKSVVTGKRITGQAR